MISFRTTPDLFFSFLVLSFLVVAGILCLGAVRRQQSDLLHDARTELSVQLVTHGPGLSELDWLGPASLRFSSVFILKEDKSIVTPAWIRPSILDYWSLFLCPFSKHILYSLTSCCLNWMSEGRASGAFVSLYQENITRVLSAWSRRTYADEINLLFGFYMSFL